MDLDETETCSYEQIRNRNVADNQAFLKELMKDFEKPKRKAQVPKKSVRRRANSGDPSFVVRRNPSRRSRAQPYTLRTRSSRKHTDDEDDGSSPTNHSKRLTVRLGSFGAPQREGPDYRESDTDDDDDEVSRTKRDTDGIRIRYPRRQTISSGPRETRKAEDISEVEMKMVAETVRDKTYDKDLGTSCHQCRQKTLDMKTICRSEECSGVRGMFCGPCLRNRYGEDAKEALKDDTWTCPPCRGICNCSICRRRSGRGCTGILVHVAKEEGFSDVSSYLLSLKAK